ncbi:chorismate-binding protein [Rarobacter faecitabidus]|uniref:Para-aminobenzoate synthetase component 1 n=1 Tax=Rarobacter faecitabidus TaxID=13243 RepID=A0A542ZVV8_RARFA|nr:chorismate-binding protein [Rarobacter faecitabidus]TQL64320.1 para-aminobenzoate synthetase component 1 [Rarobacter faecitabidus]
MPDQPHYDAGYAVCDGERLCCVVRSEDVGAHPELLAHGTWFVVATFEGRITGWQFAHSAPDDGQSAPRERHAANWRGPTAATWQSSMSRERYRHAVEQVRARIRVGEVYQANICRILSAPLGTDSEPNAAALAEILAGGNPAPFASHIHVPAGLTGVDGDSIAPIWVVSASPELYLSVSDGEIRSMPIKGTAADASGLSEKDRAENVMITDLVRNDLQRVSVPGSIAVEPILDIEQHPGLVHLVSTVRGTLARAEPDWASIFAATFPPGSVSGAPKEAALTIIRKLESAQRGPYCGGLGIVRSHPGRSVLAVGIRSFWWEPGEEAGTLRFGTGAGITYDSDPESEWQETELKAARLVALASAHGDQEAAS